MVLDAATQEGSTMLEPHFDNLNAVLFPQVSADQAQFVMFIIMYYFN